MNILKKMALMSALLTTVSLLDITAAVPCGSSGTINVGILGADLPYSDFDTNPLVLQPFGFDVDLVAAIAKVLGFKVNFVFVSSLGVALADLTAGTLDVFANSATTFSSAPGFGGVVTDISQITNVTSDEYRGYIFNPHCCALMYQFEAALDLLVENGTYADVLQKQRQDPRQIGFTSGMGLFATSTIPNGILVEPLDANSSMAGTIPQAVGGVTGATGCRSARVGLPPSNCIGQFIIFNTPNCYSFTGIIDEVRVHGTGCTTF